MNTTNPKAPRRFSSLTARCIVPLADCVRFRPGIRTMVSELAEREFWEPERLRAWQLEKLRVFLVHCADNVPFYANRFRKCGFNARGFEDLSQLQRVPPLTKEDIRNHTDDIFSRTASRRWLKRGRTGGSTGVPTPFFLSRTESAWMRATYYRFREWVGLSMGDRIVKVGGLRFTSDWRAPIIRVYMRYAENVTAFPAAALSVRQMNDYIKRLQQVRPSALWGYPSAMCLLAGRLLETGNTLGGMKCIWSTSEVLQDSQRELLRNAFECEPFDMYGGGDTHVACECQAHNGLHIVAHSRFIEVVNDDGISVSPGQTGRILVTPFFNYDWPYVRYEMGDLGETMPNATCDCGRTLPKLRRILGRTGDYILTPDGRMATIPNFTLIFGPINRDVRLYQIVQREIQAIEVFVIPTSTFTRQTEEYILESMRRFLGDSIKIDVKIAHDIDQTVSGKRKLIVSSLSKASYPCTTAIHFPAAINATAVK
jgi:phenylacetate-CoA ligase